jgi:signal transduction histidine kinase
MRVRFDDMIATVLTQAEAHPSARAAKWRQLVDLLAQRRDPDASPEAARALEWLRAHREGVPLQTRRAIAASLAGRRVSPAVIGFFGEDSPTIAAPLIGGAILDWDEWLALLPRLSPTARSLLRHRRDLAPEVEQGLASFGHADFVLSADVSTARAAPQRPGPAIEAGETQIRDLVARIEQFRREKEIAPAPAGVAPGPVESFQWESSADGVIVWVEGAPRGPLIGQTLAVTAELGRYGVDGQAAGAFEKRAPFRDARFQVAGTGAVSGDWRISGVPFFDAAQGNFLGYRGSARRPRLDEVAHAEALRPQGLFGTNLPADSLRQLIHELRTPLNAIVGFAEMIDGQYMGPAAAGYRSRAAEIMEQASRLLSAVDDLDTAARIETRRLTLDEVSVDAVALLCRLHDGYERVAHQRGSRIEIEIERNLPPAFVEQAAAERMFARMLAASIGLAREGETIAARMSLDQLLGRKMLCLAIDRPEAVEGLDEQALLDPGYSPQGDWPGAPALGLGFALRLVRNLAEAGGGALLVGPERFLLYLPVEEPAERTSGQGS